MTEPVTLPRSLAPFAPPAGLGGGPHPSVKRTDFAAILRTNELCESGGRFVASQRSTTAAAPAGYGRAQLNTRNHVEILGRLGAARLASFGLDRKDLDALHARGAAAQDWYTAIVGGHPRRGSTVTDPEARALDAITAKEPMAAADLDAIEARFGDRFRQTTGLDASELRFMAATRLLGSARLAGEYRQALRAHGDRSAALEALGDRHPALGLLRDRVGDDGVVQYFTDHRLNENRAAWYTRAAMTEEAPFERLLRGLEAGGDRVTSTRLMADHVERAFSFASGLEGFFDLPERDRLLVVGQLARLRSLAPVLFEAATRPTDDGAPLADIGALLERLDAARADPDSDAALRAFVRTFERGPQVDGSVHARA